MKIEIDVISWSGLDRLEQVRLLQRPVLDQPGLSASVSMIVEKVRGGGDAALNELTAELDGVTAQPFFYGKPELRSAFASVSPDLVSALEDAAGRIRLFHTADLPVNSKVETAPGLVCEIRYQPLSTVGLYIPGGSAPLVSTVLMLALPARLAGCSEIIMCTPPDNKGGVSSEILAAAALCGVDAVFCAGGAQAIAAMAFGTESVPHCQKIFGPGNSWVTEAKQQVSHDRHGAAIDMPAGPSEVLVIADDSAQEEFIAWDLLSQAEHGPDSQVLLLTDSGDLAGKVKQWLESLAPRSPRAAILEQSMAAARIIVMESIDQALALSNEYAPEHLIINTRKASHLAGQVVNAGSVFIGPWTPESLGDYCSGTNHVLPTYGWARSYGALGVGDFMRRMSFQHASREALTQVGPVAETLAAVEGLEAHRMAVRSRLDTAGGRE